jgi:1,4-dihydroxy-2-naphthoate octaprenyltransferase
MYAAPPHRSALHRRRRACTPLLLIAPLCIVAGGHPLIVVHGACNDRRVASFGQWIAGARPRTLPNAIAPVIAGTGAAAWLHAAVWWKALLALAVAVALIIGVNFANDYSDGIRGTDDDRAGPVRLVGSRLATPRSVLTVAVVSLSLGAAAGLALAVTSALWLIVVGAFCIAGAWLYTGGSKPYGYAGFGELAVFVFFGLVAVLGTQYTQASRVDWVGLVLAVTTGALSSAVLVANNLRDIPTDAKSGKLTLAVRLGDPGTRTLYQSLLALAGVLTLTLTAATPWCAVGLLATPLALRAVAPVRSGRTGAELIPVLRDTGLAMLVWSIAVAAALALSR